MKLTSGVVSITVTTGGSGYSSAPIVTFSGGSGAGASAVAQMAGTVVDAVVITNAGTGYTSAPNVEFSEGSADASAVVLSYGVYWPAMHVQGEWQRHVRRERPGSGLSLGRRL